MYQFGEEGVVSARAWGVQVNAREPVYWSRTTSCSQLAQLHQIPSHLQISKNCITTITNVICLSTNINGNYYLWDLIIHVY